MKLLDFSNIGIGWPYNAATFKYMQDQALQLQTISLLGGSLYVLQGCTEIAGLVGNGFVIINGEVLPFEGGAAQANVIIIETPTSKRFGDDSYQSYYKNRKATFGTADTQYAWADFENKDIVKGLLQRMREAEAVSVGIRSDLNDQIAAFNAYIPTWAEITGKPTGLIVHHGTYEIGDVSQGIYTIPIPDQADPYMAFGNIVSLRAGENPIDACVQAVIIPSSYNAGFFKIYVREFVAGVQNVGFQYFILKTS